MKKTILITFLILTFVNFTFAVPAKRISIKVQQPDGTELTIKLNGDEHFHYTTTEDGFLVTQNAENFYEYAKINSNGNIFSTGITARQPQFRTKKEISFLQTLNNGVSISNIATNLSQKRAEQKNSPKKSPAALNIGERFVVILVNYSDKSFVTPDANTAFCNMLNQTGYSVNNAIGSARDYFTESSYGQFQPVFDVFGPYNLAQNMKYYGEDSGGEGNDKRAEQLIKDACAAARNDINFSLYDGNNDGKVDNVFVVYAGYSQAEGGNSNTMWPHQYQITGTSYNGKAVSSYVVVSELRNNSGNTMSGIGTICHEFGHVLGLPDLYNTQSEYGDNNTPGYWDIMDAGCYNGPGSNGDVPCLYSAYEKFFMGWLTPEILSEAGSYTINPQQNSFLLTKNKTHNLNGEIPNPVEFIMLENRQKEGFDTYLPGKGMLAWRINYNSTAWNWNTVNTTSIKRVYVVHASTSNSAAWSFPGTGNVTSYDVKGSDNVSWNQPISNIAESNKIITFNYNGGSNIIPAQQISKIPAEEINNCVQTSIPTIKKDEFNVLNSDNSWKILFENQCSLEIYTINGILLKTFYFENEIDISKSGFSDGAYLLKIKNLSDNKTYFSKAIK